MGMRLGKRFATLNIIGGGSQDSFLDELTAKAAGVTVLAGPKEATAIGNLLVQMIAAGEVKDVAEGRELVKRSFGVRTYESKN